MLFFSYKLKTDHSLLLTAGNLLNLNLLNLSPKESLRTKEQKQNENDKRDRILPFGGDVYYTPRYCARPSSSPPKYTPRLMHSKRLVK